MYPAIYKHFILIQSTKILGQQTSYFIILFLIGLLLLSYLIHNYMVYAGPLMQGFRHSKAPTQLFYLLFGPFFTQEPLKTLGNTLEN